MMTALCIYWAIAVVAFVALMWEDTGAPDLPGVRTGTGGCAVVAIAWPVFLVIAVIDLFYDEGENP